MAINETYRNVAVVIEIDNAIKFLRNGLSEIQKISAANDFYDPPLIYLSGGLERLFKSMLCLNFKEKNGGLPKSNELWNNRNGHDIIFLKEKIEKICIPIDRPFAQNDFKIITENTIVNEICSVLSAYGSKARYFNLDAILGEEQGFDAKAKWEKIETSVLKEFYGENKFYKMLEKPKRLDEIYNKSNELLVSKIELFLRAVTRQFVFGNFSNDSTTYLFQIKSFTDIKDEQIGKTDYRKFDNHEGIKRK